MTTHGALSIQRTLFDRGNHDGMGKFLLPDAFDSPQVQTVRSLFEIVVELRVGGQGQEYRWHLQTANFTTQWLPL